MAAGTAADADKTVGATLDGFAGMLRIDDVAQNDAAVAVHRLDSTARIAETGNDHRHLMGDDDLEVRLVARVGAMYDKIDGVRRHPGLRMRVFVCTQIGRDVGEPTIKLLGRPGIDVGERPDYPGPAQGRDQGWE